MEKKLYKSSNDKVITGVCGGIGEYFAVDPVIIRILWVVFILMAGTGLIAYIIAAIIIPVNPVHRPVERTYARTEEGLNNEELAEEGAQEKVGKNTRGGLYTLGVILIVFGIIIILRSYVHWIPEEIYLALLLVGIGVYFIFGRK